MKIYFVSLGCDKNLADSEEMLGLLAENGFEITNDETEADIAVINSCCFIHDAKQESIETAIELSKLKTEGNLKVLCICGCLAQRYKDEIITEIPEVDIVIGTTAYEDIVDAVNNALEGKKTVLLKDLEYLPEIKAGRMITTGNFTSYIKIAEGCDKHCTYCIIPSLKGRYRSIPIERIVEQAKYLAANGTVELIVVAQETTIYGTDLYGEKSLSRLFGELSKIPGIHWIRVLYCYPEEIDEDLINAIKNNPKVLHYIDMPIQHASDHILKRMGRRTSRQDLVDKIELLRKEIPDICIRTTLITGFPGETEDDFESLMDFVYDMNFERLGVFTYSAEEDTPAANFPDQIDEALKQERKDAVMEMQQDIAFDNAAVMIGRKLEVLVEGFIVADNVYACRSYMDAPSIDGYVFVEAENEHISGQFINVEIVESDGYDLIAREI